MKKLIFSAALVLSLGLAGCEEEKATESDTYELTGKEIDLLNKLDASLTSEQQKTSRGNTLDEIVSIYQGVKIKGPNDDGTYNFIVTARMEEFDLLAMNAREKTLNMLSTLKDDMDLNNVKSVQFNWILPNKKLNTESVYYTIRFDVPTIQNTDWSSKNDTDMESLASYVSNEIKNSDYAK